MSDTTPLTELSDQLAAAVDRAARSTLLVSARRHIPASGIAWSADGLVLTADHVLETDEGIRVLTPDGAEHDATVVGRDPGSDIALIRVSGVTLTPPEHAPENSYQIGSLVLAVARPSDEGPMASFGILSAVGGPWQTRRRTRVSSYLRSDTTFFPGFSGGPLVDVAGRVIGINSSRLGRGAGLTIPLTAASPVISDLINSGRVRRPYLGVSSQVAPLPPALANAVGGQETALLVVTVEQGSPADTAGIGIGDILVRIDDVPLPDTESLQAQLTPERIGNAARFTILRGGSRSEVTIIPSERAW